MASRENSKADSQTASELKLVDDESLEISVLASLPWNQPPLCWLTPEQQSRLKSHSETLRLGLGEKIWSKEAIAYQFFIAYGKVRLREEDTGKSLATLEVGDWFGDLQKFPAECKAVAASKEVIVVRWNAALWAEFSTPQIEAFWRSSQETRKDSRG